MNSILLNAGVPMIFPSMMVIIDALIPIILLEAVCCCGFLGVTFWNALKVSACSNIFSTFIGLPVTWFLLILLRYITDGGRTYNLKSKPLIFKIALFVWEAHWMFPRGHNYHWTIYASGLILIVPFFFASWFSEFWIVVWFSAAASADAADRAVRNANLLSYFFPGGLRVAAARQRAARLWRVLARKSIVARRRQRLSGEPSPWDQAPVTF